MIRIIIFVGLFAASLLLGRAASAADGCTPLPMPPRIDAAEASDAPPGIAHCLIETAPQDMRTPAKEAAEMVRTLKRRAKFAHRLVRPENPDGRTIVLLHGSGGDETSLLKLAMTAAPGATLLGVRGRIEQEGVSRWYRRVTPVSFDQDDIMAEAEAFADFLRDTAREYGLDLDRTTFLGYSNGANLVGALTMLHPELVRSAVLLRAMPVLEAAPAADLASKRFLTIAGQQDETYSPFAPKLQAMLTDGGATVDARFIPAGHLLGDEDARIVGEWLASGPALSMND